MQKGEEVQGRNTPGMDILTTGEEIVLKLDMDCEGRR